MGPQNPNQNLLDFSIGSAWKAYTCQTPDNNLISLKTLMPLAREPSIWGKNRVKVVHLGPLLGEIIKIFVILNK